MRVLARLRRWYRDLRAFWAANLRVAGAWRQDRNRLDRYVLLTCIVDALALAGAAWALESVRFHGLANRPWRPGGHRHAWRRELAPSLPAGGLR
jgi:hypothetical protein